MVIPAGKHGLILEGLWRAGGQALERAANKSAFHPIILHFFIHFFLAQKSCINFAI
jgi:hypothetical protein